MAKKIKFPLEMSNGEEVRTLDELKENFDIKSIVGYFNDGKLLNWLKARYYDKESEKISALSKDDPQLQKKLCDIFGIENKGEEVDVEKVARRTERLNRLKQYTDDKEILERVDLVAFNQEDLGDLLDEEKPLIYLCHNKFIIPLRETHKEYIGIGKAVAVIRSKEIVDFDKLHIKFKNVILSYEHNDDTLGDTKTGDKKTVVIPENESIPEKLFDEATKAYDEGDYETALKKFQDSSRSGNLKAANRLGFLYFTGINGKKNIEESKKWLKVGMDNNDGDSYGSYAMTIIYGDVSPTEVQKNIAFKYMKKATELCPDSALWQDKLGDMYHDNFGTERNPDLAVECYEKAVKLGSSSAANKLGDIYSFEGTWHSPIDHYKAFEFYKKAVELNPNNKTALKNLAYSYLHGKGVEKNSEKAKHFFQLAESEDNPSL